jgi:hypothetical protein
LAGKKKRKEKRKENNRLLVITCIFFTAVHTISLIVHFHLFILDLVLFLYWILALSDVSFYIHSMCGDSKRKKRYRAYLDGVSLERYQVPYFGAIASDWVDSE